MTLMHIDDNDPDLEGLIFTPIEQKFNRCTSKQREYMERLARKQGKNYKWLLGQCKEVCGKEVRDIGELSKGEASRVIVKMGGREYDY